MKELDHAPLGQHEFVTALLRRLARGARDYGDLSFDRPIPELLDELALEALDLAGWGFVLWEHIQRLQHARCVQREKDQ